MTDQRKYRQTSGLREYSSQGEHPDPAIPTALIAQTRAPYYGATPTWPTTMIGPSVSELARWAELWNNPRAAGWVESEQECAVAALVRVEQRCGRNVPSALAELELGRLRDQLGLGEA
jgi:hypothetical protein